ncbi:MAG: radical SAM protein [Nitrospinae bacterium]|nr:radical SAM protein [Nitrospinota bacterium]
MPRSLEGRFPTRERPTWVGHVGLQERIETAYGLLEACRLCPRRCGVNRLKGEKGFCRSGLLPIISSYGPHFGEERPLVGLRGSGTIFFTHCNLGCVFCQNYDISHGGHGREISLEQLADLMVELQEEGCHNLNFVTPTHFSAQILAALPQAIAQGLNLPLVYNCGGYESLEVLGLLEGLFDIYMPDLKFADSQIGQAYCAVPDYFEVAREALKEMHRQVGDLLMDERGIAQRGLLIRHLVLPNGLAGTQEAMEFLAHEVSRHTYVNLMDQYRPCYEASRHAPLNRRITRAEFEEALRITQQAGLYRLDGF